MYFNIKIMCDKCYICDDIVATIPCFNLKELDYISPKSKHKRHCLAGSLVECKRRFRANGYNRISKNYNSIG